jgi:hypothetical protein
MSVKIRFLKLVMSANRPFSSVKFRLFWTILGYFGQRNQFQHALLDNVFLALLVSHATS